MQVFFVVSWFQAMKTDSGLFPSVGDDWTGLLSKWIPNCRVFLKKSIVSLNSKAAHLISQKNHFQDRLSLMGLQSFRLTQLKVKEEQNLSSNILNSKSKHFFTYQSQPNVGLHDLILFILKKAIGNEWSNYTFNI